MHASGTLLKQKSDLLQLALCFVDENSDNACKEVEEQHLMLCYIKVLHETKIQQLKIHIKVKMLFILYLNTASAKQSSWFQASQPALGPQPSSD